MQQPDFNTREYEILRHLQGALCRLYVHLVRMTDLEEAKQSIKSEPDTPNEWPRIERQRRISMVSHADEEAVPVVADQLRRWVLRARHDNIVPRDLGKGLIKLGPKIEAIRDIRQHFEEYHRPNYAGKKPINHFFEVEDGKGFWISAAGSLQINGDYHFGGKLSANALSMALRELYDGLNSNDLWLLPWTPAEIVAEMRASASIHAPEAPS